MSSHMIATSYPGNLHPRVVILLLLAAVLQAPSAALFMAPGPESSRLRHRPVWTRTVPRHQPRTIVLGKWHQHGWRWNNKHFGQQLFRTSPFRFFCSIFIWMSLQRGNWRHPRDGFVAITEASEHPGKQASLRPSNI